MFDNLKRGLHPDSFAVLFVQAFKRKRKVFFMCTVAVFKESI